MGKKKARSNQGTVNLGPINSGEATWDEGVWVGSMSEKALNEIMRSYPLVRVVQVFSHHGPQRKENTSLPHLPTLSGWLTTKVTTWCLLQPWLSYNLHSAHIRGSATEEDEKTLKEFKPEHCMFSLGHNEDVLRRGKAVGRKALYKVMGTWNSVIRVKRKKLGWTYTI